MWRFFVPAIPRDEQLRRVRQKDYEYLLAHGVETEPGFVTLHGRPIIHKHPDAQIILGKDVTIISESEYNDAGINHPTILAATEPGAKIIIHDGVGMSGSSIVAEKRVEVGENTMLGANTNIYDTDFHPVDSEARLVGKKAESSPIRIGKRCWLASNTTVLKGVEIGDETVIGAMSLVNKDIPTKVLAAGVPARIIRDL